MNEVLFGLMMQLICSLFFWGIFIKANGWYIRKQIKRSFEEHYRYN